MVARRPVRVSANGGSVRAAESAPTAEHMPIEELARRTGMTVRNLRALQARGLLAAPELAGRKGFYTERHLARVALVRRMQSRGFSLASIKDVLASWEAGVGLMEVVGFEDAMTTPGSDGVRREVDVANATAGAKAVQEVVSKLHISAADAQARLQDLTTVPVTQLQLLQTAGPKVVAAEAALKDLATIPPAQLQLLQTSGSKVATAQAQLVALGKIPAKDVATLKQAQKASAASPKQWRNYFWIAVGGEVVFIPLIFLLTGYWSPRRARKQEQEHEAWVEAELAKLGSGGAAT
jgi:DNA-binding transcriptional MerR regulator